MQKQSLSYVIFDFQIFKFNLPLENTNNVKEILIFTGVDKKIKIQSTTKRFS